MEILGADEKLRNEILRNEILRADADALVNFPNNSALFKCKQRKYLNNFQRTFEMPLTNCEINFILTCSENCVKCNSAAN